MAPASDLWSSVSNLIDAQPEATPVELMAHGVHLLAADHWRRSGRSIPSGIAETERAAARRALCVPVLLARVRNLLDGPILLLKGPEIATAYPDPMLRPFGDIDLLVPDPETAQRTLLAAGFVLVDDYSFAHQQKPLAWPGLPLLIEIHNYPKWLRWMNGPAHEELFAHATPSATGVSGIDTLCPPHHAMLVAAHAWRHLPFRRVLDLIDVAAISASQDARRLDELAERWEMARVWRTTSRAVDELFYGQGRSWPLHLWARHLRALRDRGVVEQHLILWMGDLWAPAPGAALRAAGNTIIEDLRPLKGEAWPVKLARMRRAALNPFLDRSSLAREVAPAARSTRDPIQTAAARPRNDETG
jgi:hypothetical protein